ncbi:hypothetical protein ACFSC4_13880 [Deinococcus malanensis]|uniref:hypothetical protein n=1 Tax=Deinococcus malanensis TaxID=1706855 RepID=UPI00363EEC58
MQGAVQEAVDGALHWGSPVLESALTQITEGHLVYCGLDALILSEDATVEEVAALLWTGTGRAGCSCHCVPGSISAPILLRLCL